MTSKNVLLMGVLLFLLLVTLCSAFFWDRYNPDIETVNPGQSETAVSPSSFHTNTMEESFVEEVPIRTIPKTNSSLTVSVPKEPLKKPSPGKTVIKEHPASIRNVHAEINATDTKHQIASDRNESLRQTPSVQKNPPVKGKTSPAQESGAKKKKIIIEPVVETKVLTVSRSGQLFRWDRPYLKDLARQLKEQKNLYVVLRTPHITDVKRRYMQHIRDYMVKLGINPKRIKMVTKAKATKVSLTETQNNHVELLLTERM